jgi:hypothetical protein
MRGPRISTRIPDMQLRAVPRVLRAENLGRHDGRVAPDVAREVRGQHEHEQADDSRGSFGG